MNLFKKSALAATLAASALVAATPAQARDGWRHRGGGDDAAIAIGAGIIGLAVGAAIASDHDDRYDDRYYDRGYYRGGYYGGGYYQPRYRGGYYYNTYPSYPAYRGYYRNDGWRDHDRGRHEWREHERREHDGDRGYRRGW